MCFDALSVVRHFQNDPQTSWDTSCEVGIAVEKIIVPE
jgi:hypothetical protein